MNAIIKIYDYFTRHHALLWSLFAVLLVGMLWLVSTLHLHEDISDFLPSDAEYTESMEVYSSLNEASRIVFIFSGNDPDSIGSAIDELADLCPDAITEPDMDGFFARLDFIYAHLPYFLRDSDYVRMDSAMAHLPQVLATDRTILSMPGTSFLTPSVMADPFRLIPLSYGAMGQYAGAQSTSTSAFTAYDGYMMTADHRMGFAFYDSPNGSTESARNAVLVDSLNTLCRQIEARYPAVSVRLLGAPVIAVGNARRIKADTIWAIGLSSLLLLLLLLYAFPRRRDIVLIVMTLVFGWLFGAAALALCTTQVSIIVLGISSVLLGISVNYPLHLLVHQRYTTSVRQTLQEVISPLVIGNITTVGAFMALIPLHAPALQQLGIFAAFNMLGTILFCIFCLPHLMSAEPTPVRDLPLRLPRAKAEGYYRWTTWVVLAGLVLAACVPLVIRRPLFDSNLSHINYMTDQQRADFAWFESLSPVSDEPAYLASSARDELARRLQLWNDYWQQHDAEQVAEQIREEAARQGFFPSAFAPFIQRITTPFTPPDTHDPHTLAALWPGRFDSAALNSFVATSLSDNFDYLGSICSLIVLIFLCFSFRSVLLGLVAFLPMVFSWVIIVAVMQVFGLQFNIVNVILATFIFGQGDDYTIFVLEGLLYEQKHGRPMLEQYQQSIYLSALMMLVSIGVLVVAQHPAMYSLGILTLVGMASVVMMALLLPRLLLHALLRLPKTRAYILRRL
ncbi:MAG: hypothetical protein MJZ89_04930 [Paludibacteraceae bacterium]|nr:hypothetical protein [Paludibacteraceae bacterium]